MLHTTAATPQTVPRLPVANLDIGSFLSRRYCEMPADPAFLFARLNVLRAGLQRMTDEDRRDLFPFHGDEDAYGPKYVQEAGLKHETKDGENK